MTKSRNINQPKHCWTAIELAELVEQYPHRSNKSLADLLGLSLQQVNAKARRMGLAKSAQYLASEQSGRIQAGKQTPSMIASRFKPGSVSWNKGMKGLEFEGSKPTQFKLGLRPHTWVPVGSYRINSDGYLDQKTTDDGPPYKHWEAVHRLVWKAAHGPIPAGHVVIFRKGRRSTVLEQITADSLECISRSELSMRNQRSLPPELRQLVQLRGAITRQINQAKGASV